MKKWLIILAAVIAMCVFTGANADDYPVLGKSFPEFQAKDLDQNVYSLSGALEDHEAVLINLWASWCGPCIREFPFLNEVYEQYGDRVAFIGLTIEPEDSWETLRLAKIIHHISYPEIKEAGTGILDFLGGSLGTPTTIIVDRFGTVVYIQAGAFKNSGEIARLLDVFLGDDYTESKPLKEIPYPSETQALPVSSSRRMWVENEDARRIVLRAHYNDPDWNAFFGEQSYEGWVVHEDSVRLAIEIKASDDLSDVILSDYNHDAFFDMFSLLDRERNVLTYEMPLQKPKSGDTWFCVALGTKTGNLDMDPDFLEIFLFPDEAAILDMIEFQREENVTVTWEYADEEPEPEKVQEAACILHTVDQYGQAVPGVLVNFCTDELCTPVSSDENGIISCTGAPENCHVQVLKAPEGYSFDPDFEMQTGSGFGEWVLVVRRD